MFSELSPWQRVGKLPEEPWYAVTLPSPTHPSGGRTVSSCPRGSDLQPWEAAGASDCCPPPGNCVRNTPPRLPPTSREKLAAFFVSPQRACPALHFALLCLKTHLCLIKLPFVLFKVDANHYPYVRTHTALLQDELTGIFVCMFVFNQRIYSHLCFLNYLYFLYSFSIILSDRGSHVRHS